MFKYDEMLLILSGVKMQSMQSFFIGNSVQSIFNYNFKTALGTRDSIVILFFYALYLKCTFKTNNKSLNFWTNKTFFN
jgi:hypothetical protein